METWIQSDGYNPREWDWPKRNNADFPIAVSFEPFNGLWPIYCDCHGIINGIAVLNIPEKSDDTLKQTDWFPPSDECWILTSEKFIRPQ